MTNDRRPRVFIGSSAEAIPYARAVSSTLERIAEINPWFASGGTFGPNEYTMESLETELSSNDFGVFIFTPDDVAVMRGKPVFITRDNTVFEMGLFWGRLGRQRVFAIIPRNLKSRDDVILNTTVSEFHLLSDLTGLTLLTYDAQRSDERYASAVDTACGEIIKAIKSEGLFYDPQIELKASKSVLHFFWNYVRNVTVPDTNERYASFAEAVRNSFLVPYEYRVTGAAIWKKDQERVVQVGGNVGRHRSFHVDDNDRIENGKQRIIVLDALKNGEWSFFLRREVLEFVHVLCYPLGENHVLSVHLAGKRELNTQQLENIVHDNNELLVTINHLVGGDLK